MATAVSSFGLWLLALLWSLELTSSLTVLVGILGAAVIVLANCMLDRFADSVSPAISEMTGYVTGPLAMMAGVNLLGATALVGENLADLFPVMAVFAASGLVHLRLKKHLVSDPSDQELRRGERSQPATEVPKCESDNSGPVSTIPLPGVDRVARDTDDLHLAPQLIEGSFEEEQIDGDQQSDSTGVSLSQQLGWSESGAMFVSGWLRVELSRASSVTHEIVSFPKAFSGIPEVELEPENPDVQVRLVNSTEIGMRLRLELDPRASSPISTTVAFYASVPEQVAERGGTANLPGDARQLKAPLP